MNIRARFITLTIIFSVLFVAGCSDDGKTAKNQLLDALTNQQQIQRHTYTGSLDLDLGPLAIQAADQPYTAVILNAMRQGKISWNGGEDPAAQNHDAEFHFATDDDAMTLTVPILRRADQIYVHVPLINAEEEYFSMTAPPQVDQLGPASLSALSHLITAMDKSWFTMSQQNEMTTVRMTITEQNWLPFLKKLNEALPNMINEWKEANIITAQLATSLQEKWQTAAAEPASRIRLVEDEDAYIEVKIGTDGYIASFEVRLVLEIMSTTGTFERYGAQLYHQWDQLDGSISLREDIPESTVPLEDLLRFIPLD